MIRHDLTHWPLVLSTMSGPTTPEDQLAFFADWMTWLNRGEAFATLRVFADADALTRQQGSGREAKAWLHANGERLKALVVGMATVVPADKCEEMSRINAEKLFGVPARTFQDAHEAIIWIGHLLTDRRVGFDPWAIQKSLEELVFTPR
ncbi:hypothetical protein [Bradyrhizobium sp. 2S1]|uniref:hypothetical protein n=1 Tax=Bradyrhizobium sp. 2S1 TaxID=1404429 RepID=UPI00140D902D|nr:hypothetical protein [Bradyrhizobium sp. 2S1]MCK7673418.1 hypothetical protein [Bradyrhizobium sp. 2S1]